MERITWHELCEIMKEHNRKTGEDYHKAIYGVVVYRADNFAKPYSLQERSYRVSSHNKAFRAGMISNSIFGDCLDGKDVGVRLDLYSWRPEFCYMEEVE